ncbi:hypothetical protein QBC40DRAFT_261660 [Triangularia verruculosa]|uniref:RRM domain-containing protein n=1 Tax=Triangularia verruculosa TaxID=2587418 RepID=A0AAN6XTW5_9PEZI|nr:hypothetical protein QBC40DRAFT_261660 [Triangularia verruculosa]
MSRNQARHHQNLVLVTVPPGCVTDLYYITIANFSHSTTWKDLKVFVSQVCEVDFCLTYDPTSGFVRVKGQENFEKAYHFLNGRTLHDRCLQADGRNRDKPTFVKLPPNDYHAIMLLQEQQRGRVVVDDPSATQPAPDQYYSYPASSSPPDMRRNSEYTSPTQYTTTTTNHWNYPPYTTTTTNSDYPTSPSTTTTTYNPDLSSPSYSYQTVGAPDSYYTTSSSPYTHPTTANLPPIINTPLTTDFSDLSSFHPLPTNNKPVVTVEYRKIILLGLDKRWVSPSNVADLLTTAFGGGDLLTDGDGGQVERIEVPIGSKSKEAKGTAFITFASAGIALEAIDRLNGATVGERKITARMAEGVAASRDGKGGYATRGGGSSNSSKKMLEEQKRESRREKKAQGLGGSGGGNGGNGGGGWEQMPPVVVDGSRGKGGGAREGAPVIVNGTSGWWRRERK